MWLPRGGFVYSRVRMSRTINGNQISIQWGKGCYGSYRDSNPNPQTSTAEVLITNSSVDGCPIEPMGWCDSDMVALLIFQASNLTWDNIVKKYK